MLKFITDIHISPLTVTDLQVSGYDAERVTRYLPCTAADTEIIELAGRIRAVIITQDLDFSALIAQSGLNMPSVISLRIGNAQPAVISQLLRHVIPQVIEYLEKGAIVSVDEMEFRVRLLPVTTG